MKAEPLTQIAPTLKSGKPFFGAKKLVVKLNKPPERAAKPLVLRKKPKTAGKVQDKETSDKKAILSLKKPFAEIKSTSTKYQKHKEPETVLEEAQKAAILPSEKANKSVANRSHVEVMESQTKDTKKFDKVKFKNNLKKQINDTIKSKEDAKKIKNKGVGEDVTKDIGQSIEDEKSNAGGKVESSTSPPVIPKPPTNEVTIDEPKGLVKDMPAAKTLTTQKGALAPSKRAAEETDFTKETKILDDEYKQNNLSKENLQNSNEPSFISADNQKQDSEANAAELTNQNRKDESKLIGNTRFDNIKAINGSYSAMQQNNAAVIAGRFDKQKTKAAEEYKIRNDVSRELEKIFSNTNKTVLTYFNAIDFYIEKIFGLSLTSYLDKFSRRVAKLLDENTGFFNKLGAAVTGDELLSEVQIFDIAKEEFIEDMQKPIDDLVNTVDLYLTAANNAIKKGKEETDKFWNKQSDETKQIADDIYDDSTIKFEELESSVDSKEGAVIDTVTEKFSNALDELDSRFEKAVEENKSWLDRAIDAVKAVINTIIELKNSIKSIAKKAAKYAEEIIDDPITFFGNLSDGVGLGFENFKKNIDKHLIKGVLEWLTGSMAGSDIVLPKELNLEGITSLVLQILGITIKKIKGLVIDVIGKERFEFIEKGVDAGIAAGNKILDIFKILNEKGLSGLWEYIKEEFSDLKEMLIENVKTFVMETITRKAMEFLLSLLIPGAGFIRAAQLLIRFVVTLFQKAAQIVKIIDGIIESFGNILRKDIAGAAEMVENVLSGFISLAISFLAAVLGLGGIVSKVQKFIQQKIRPKIDKILNNIAKKIKEVITKIGLTKLIDKSMHAVEKGKAWVDDKKTKVKEKAKANISILLKWLGFKKSYKSKDGYTHTLSFEEKNGIPEMMRSSMKSSFEDYIINIKIKVLNYNKINPSTKVNFKAIENQFKIIKSEMGDYSKYDKNSVSAKMNKFAELLSQLPDELADSNIFFPNINIKSKTKLQTRYRVNQISDDGNSFEVENLSLKLGSLQGSPGKYKSKLFTHIHNKITTKNQLIRGHLLNHYLGGNGEIPENIMPIAKSTNDDMERSSNETVTERHAKQKLLTGFVFDYAVIVNYTKSKKLDAEVPTYIKMSLIQKQFDDTKVKNKANMEIGDNWKKVAGISERTIDAKQELENLI